MANLRVIVVGGRGNQGKKRLAVAGNDVVGIADYLSRPYREVTYVPLVGYDAALVCVPAQEAPPIVQYLIDNKKHVLVEKPFTPIPTQGTILYIAYNHRFEPHIVRMKELINSGKLGKLYHCRMFYGNGTAENVRGSWRDTGGNSVMSEIGTHLIDLNDYLFGHKIKGDMDYQDYLGTWENLNEDHAITTFDGIPTIQHEVTYLSWKNTFTIDLLAEHGSAHIDGLTKWGASTFTHRIRQHPPGPPTETSITIVQPDGTWAAEYQHFKKLCGAA